MNIINGEFKDTIRVYRHSFDLLSKIGEEFGFKVEAKHAVFDESLNINGKYDFYKENQTGGILLYQKMK